MGEKRIQSWAGYEIFGPNRSTFSRVRTTVMERTEKTLILYHQKVKTCLSSKSWVIAFELNIMTIYDSLCGVEFE